LGAKPKSPASPAAAVTAPPPDWDDFRLFAAVVRTGSFTRAAHELGVSEPTISRRISRLETALGARLFDRSKGRPQLTTEGKRVLDHATTAENSLTRAAAVMQDSSRQAVGDCNLIMGDGLGCYWLPPFLNAFYQHNPAVDLRLFTSQEMGKDQTPPFDIQIHYLQPLAADRVAVHVGMLHFMLYAAPEYVRRFGTPMSIQDLRHHRIADSTSGLAARGSLMSWASLTKNVAFTTNSNVVLGEALLKGSVVTLAATYTSAIYPDLVHFLPEVHFQAPIYLCFEREAGSRPAVRATIEYLKKFVFARATMPWFADRFMLPQKNWRKLFDTSLANAALSEGPEARGG
jgi:molybdate transport repressor ModE-like protein